MPYQWSPARDSAPETLRLWPNRSLSPRGFVVIIGLTSVLLALPLLALLGTSLLWGILPFVVGAVAFLYWAVTRSWKDGELREELVIESNLITLTRHEPRKKAPQVWSANPHWVRVERHESGGPVEHYLTLSGEGRMVEIGAFLSPEERQSLEPELREAIARTGRMPIG